MSPNDRKAGNSFMIEIFQAEDEHYDSDIGKVGTCLCGICLDEMEVKRGNPPYNSFVGAICNRNRHYDLFWCKNRQEDWHIQARALMKKIAETPSKKIADIMQEELEEVLLKRIATK